METIPKQQRVNMMTDRGMINNILVCAVQTCMYCMWVPFAYNTTSGWVCVVMIFLLPNVLVDIVEISVCMCLAVRYNDYKSRVQEYVRRVTTQRNELESFRTYITFNIIYDLTMTALVAGAIALCGRIRTLVRK